MPNTDATLQALSDVIDGLVGDENGYLTEREYATLEAIADQATPDDDEIDDEILMEALIEIASTARSEEEAREAMRVLISLPREGTPGKKIGS